MMLDRSTVTGSTAEDDAGAAFAAVGGAAAAAAAGAPVVVVLLLLLLLLLLLMVVVVHLTAHEAVTRDRIYPNRLWCVVPSHGNPAYTKHSVKSVCGAVGDDSADAPIASPLPSVPMM